MAFFPWYLILKHRFFSSGAIPAARLVNPLLEGLIVLFSGSGFQYSGFGSTIKDLCYLLTRGLPNEFPFLRFLGFVRPKAPIQDGVPRPTGNVPNQSTRSSYRQCLKFNVLGVLKEHYTIFENINY